MNVTKEWLAKARITNDSAGALIAAMRQDPGIPDWFPHARAMCEYVQSLEGYVRYLDGIEVVWRRYRTWVYRNTVCKPVASRFPPPPPVSSVYDPPAGTA